MKMWESLQQKISDNAVYIGNAMFRWFDLHLINILVILIGAYFARKIATKFLSQAIKHTVRHDLFPTEFDRKKRVQTLDALVGATVRLLIWFIATLMIISEIGINTAPLLASAGILGVALGFGAQSLIKDFMSGMFIIIENQYRVGDVVELSNISGTVEQITIRTTVVRDLNGDLHHIPNGTIAVTTNMTMDFAQINEKFTVALDTDIEELEHVINHVGEQLAADPAHKRHIIKPPRFDRVDGFDKDGMIVRVFGKTSPGEQWAIKGAFYKSLNKAFKKHHIEVPHAQLTIHEAKKNSA